MAPSRRLQAAAALTCPNCGLTLPPYARFCARCGVRFEAGPQPVRGEHAPVWVQVLFWLGAGGLFWIAVIYLAFAVGLVPADTLGSGTDTSALRRVASGIAAVAGVLAVAQAAAAFGLAARRPWSRILATVVCVVWALTCIGLPVGLLAIGALWRSRTPDGPLGPATR